MGRRNGRRAGSVYRIVAVRMRAISPPLQDSRKATNLRMLS